MNSAVTTKPLASCFLPGNLVEISATPIRRLIGTEMAFRVYLDQTYCGQYKVELC